MTKLSILLADDSRFFRDIESQFLQKTPTEILEADDCDTALAMVRNERPDLIYLSFSLPPTGGLGCCQRIKKDPELRTIPVVIVCDPDAPEQPELAREKGCDACLSKPLDKHSFLQLVRQFLPGVREHRQPTFFCVTILSGGEEFAGKCLDLSGGGMFVESQADFPPGTEIELSFKLPGVPGAQLSCSAVISWLNRKPNPLKPHYPYGLGIKFAKLPEAVHKAILRISDKKTSN
jgi:CheY-like chemotaxis protein/Tfp pilus assembly protein PilZ